MCNAGPPRAGPRAARLHNSATLHSNAVTLTWSFYDGGLNFNGTVPITGASVPVFSYYHSFSFFGRSANVTASLPYAVGTFSGSVLGTQRSIYRSGLLDFSARLSVNLKGACNARADIRQVEAEDAAGRQSEDNRADRSIRSRS